MRGHKNKLVFEQIACGKSTDCPSQLQEEAVTEDQEL